MTKLLSPSRMPQLKSRVDKHRRPGQQTAMNISPRSTAPRGSASRRLTREDWIVFAKRALVQSGIDDVKVDRLAKRAQVTRGSFYWHFKNRKDLLDALLRDWEVRNHIEVAEIRERWAQRQPDIGDVFAVWLAEDVNFLDFDIAIRSWGRKVSPVGDVVRRVDDAWISLLEQLYEAHGYKGEDRLVRARIAYFHQIGYHALAFREDQAERLALVPAYHRALMGGEPSAEFLERVSEIGSPRKGTRKPRRS
jgi:hypothetical protein